MFQILSCEVGNCCRDYGIVMILDVLRKIFGVVQVIAPILLIIVATIEFTKLMTDPERKNGIKRVKNMFQAAAMVFFVPVFVNAVLNILPDSFAITDCWRQAQSVAESSRKLSFKYVSPYGEQEKTNIISDPSDYEKGVPSSQFGGEIVAGSARGILEGAEKVHTMYEQNKWAYYSTLNQLRWGDIKYSTNNPSKMTCCATFVGSALYVGGVISESVINKYNYNSAPGISKMCSELGFVKISSYSQLAAGDIVVMSGPKGGSSIGHVQIYAGNGTWYNAGSTNAIQRDSPYSGDASARFLWAWRMPS